MEHSNGMTTFVICIIVLGHSHYIVWLTRSSDVVKLCPTRKKTRHFILFLFFPPTYTKKQRISFQKLHKSIWNFFFFFPIEKLTFQLFLFFPPTRVKILIFIFIFSPPTKHETPLLEFVDQTIY